MRRAGNLLLLIVLSSCAVGTAGSVDFMGSEGEVLVMDDGEKLALRSWLPAEKPRAVVVGLHGINDYSGAFALPAPFLAEQGIAFYAFDQRGFGASPSRGLWPGVERIAADARQAVRLIGARHGDIPLFLLGESMGGAVAVAALTGKDPPDASGLILVAPAVWGGRHFNRIYRTALAIGDKVAPGLALSGRLSGVTLSDNSELVAALRKDPLVVQKSSIASLNGVVKLMDAALEGSSNLELPVLLLYGLKDEVVPKKALCDFMTRPRQRPLAAFYPEGYHLLLRDLQRETVLEDIVSWVFDGESPLPSSFGHGCE